MRAAPASYPVWEFYRTIVRDETYREKVDSITESLKMIHHCETAKHCRKRLMKIYAEIDWLGNEYRSCSAESYGLFTWKKMLG